MNFCQTFHLVGIISKSFCLRWTRCRGRQCDANNMRKHNPLLCDTRETTSLSLGCLPFSCCILLNNRQNYVRIPGGISQRHPVLSGLPQGTVLGHLPFISMIIDINKGIFSNSKLVSFSDDTRVYSCINNIGKCDQLQIHLNSVYDWSHVNNMF